MQMPRDSAFVRAIDPEGSGFDHQIADLIDVVAASAGVKGWHYPRPGEKQAQIDAVSARARRWEEQQAAMEKRRAEALARQAAREEDPGG